MGINNVLRVRPKPSLSVTGFVVSAIILVPLSLLLLWYVGTNGAWRWIVTADVALTALSVSVLVRQLTVFVAVTKDELIGNGIFSRVVSVKIAEIRKVVLARVYTRHSSETSIQFVALDADGNCLFRMRGAYWHSSDLQAVAAALGVEVKPDDTPLNAPEFFAEYPRSRYWFERAT